MARSTARVSPARLPRLIEDNIERVGDAVSTLQDEAQKLQKRLVTRGRKAEQQGVRQIRQVIREIRKSDVAERFEGARKDVEKAFRDGVTEVLKILNVPTRREVEALERRVSALEPSRSRKTRKKKAARRTK